MSKSQRDCIEGALAEGRKASPRRGVDGASREASGASDSGNTAVLGRPSAGKAALLQHASMLAIIRTMRREADRSAMTGDPQLHVHCVIPNFAWVSDNG